MGGPLLCNGPFFLHCFPGFVVYFCSMTPIQQALEARFGHEQVRKAEHTGTQDLLLVEIRNVRTPVTILVTNGLSDYKMQVPENLEEEAHVELYFCLPSYWDPNDHDNPQMNWIYPWIERLAVYVREKQTWFGHGHTMACGAEMASLSETMRENHFFLTRPILLEEALRKIELPDGRIVHFLAIIPIFEDEMDYKQGKGTLKLLKKLVGREVDEKLDDYRKSVLRSNWRWNR